MKTYQPALRILCPLLAAFAALASVPPASALTLPVSEDTYASSAKLLTKAAGGATTLTVSSAHAAFIRFEAGAFAGDLPAANVTSARLIVYVPRVTKAGALTLHIVTAEWTEVVSVNTSQPAFDPAPLATIPLQEVVAKQFIIIDVTAAVKGWLTTPASDFGFAIVGDATANVMLGAKEGPGSGYPATLQIETGGAGVGGLGTLNGADLVGGSVVALALADGAVTGPKLALGSITNAHLAPGFIFPATTASIADGSLTAAKIASGQVVKTVNGLSDAVSLAPGSNITLTPSGNTLTISASGAISSDISHDATLAGSGTIAAPLGIASGAFGAWQTISSATTALANTNYAATGAVQVVVTLPASPAVADVVRVAGVGPGGWKFLPNAGQTVVGHPASSELVGGKGVTGAVQYLGGNQWQGLAESQIAAGAITGAQLAGNLTLAGTTSGTFSGDGAALTNLAGGTLAPASIGNAQLAAASVSTTSLADGSVTTPKLADSAVTGAKLAPGSVTNAHIAAGFTFPSGTPADGSITTAKLAPGAASGNLTLPLSFSGPVGGSALSITNTGSGGGIFGQAGTGANGIQGNNTTTGTSGTGVAGTSNGGIGIYGSSSSNRGIYGVTTTAGTTVAGIWGENTAAGGTAVVGNTLAASSAGVAGIGDTASSTGVYGRGTSLGVSGNSTSGSGVAGTSTNGDGVYGLSGKGSPSVAGVWGENSATGGTGVVGNALAVNSAGMSGIGDTSGSTGVYGRGKTYGVFGTTSTASTTTAGVWGENTAIGGTGVVGNAANTFSAGVSGIGDTTGSTGVYGRGASYGVYGTSPSAPGVYGSSDSSYGVFGQSTSSHGVYGSTSGAGSGVYGENYNTGFLGSSAGVTGVGHSGIGVHGIESSGGFAGYFDGFVTVTTTLYVLGSKSFKIDHPLDPENKYLVHSCIESPDVKNLYDGNVTTDGNGNATITLPSYFEALNRDFRYQLTVLGQFAQAIVASEIKDNRFTIQTDKPNVKVSWQVTGIRQDAYMKAHPMIVEQDKPAAERGTYTHPEDFGQPEEKGLFWKHNPALALRLKDERSHESAQTPPK